MTDRLLQPMERKLKDYAVLALKGMGMGAADVVPGVSGGTIAFIVGIYDELIDSIKSINGKSLKLLFLESNQCQLPFLHSSGNRYQCLFAGQADHLAADGSSHPGVVFLFRSGSGFHLVCIERHQGMELEDDSRFCSGSSPGLLYHSCYAGRNTFQPAVYIFVWSHCHLCHDSSGNIGQLYSGVAG